ncbi:MAG: RecT family recombinase [Pseudomonadota bacterium]
MSTARQAAIAAESASIEASQSRAIAAREAESRPRNALEAMAQRLQVSPSGLKDTLMQTVFSACRSDAEFIALTIVANTYDLNPLTKEIYAFPKKGGGIQPMISYDGWIKIMNSHPQTDGFEFNHTLNEKGDAIAVEGVFYRKDRSRPIKKMVYLKEFKRNTEPWNNSPNHMLDVRCLCHTVRIALGINAGVEGESEDVVIDGGSLTVDPMPSRKALAESGTSYNEETGEIKDEPARDDRGMTVVDEETERALDQANDGTLSAENPSAAEGPADEDRGEAVEDDRPAWSDFVESIKARIAAAKTKTELGPVDADFLKQSGALPDEVAQEIEGLFAEKRRELA